MRRLVLLISLAACAGKDPGAVPAPGSPPDKVEHCPTLAAVAIGAGGRFIVPHDGIDTVRVTTLPHGFTVLDDSPGVLSLRASWEAGDYKLALDLGCGRASASVQVDVQVSPIRWTPLPKWKSGTEGPVGREYFTFWRDQGNPDRALLYGGFHYAPVQFTVSNDFWSLDLVSGTWTRLPDPVGSPGLAGGAVATVPGERKMLWYGGLRGSNGATEVPFVVSELDYAADAPAFTPRQVAHEPPSGAYQPMWFYDEPRGRYLAVCGADLTGYMCKVRSYDPAAGTWTVLSTTGEEPPGRDGMFWVHDAENQRLVFFSGDRGDPTGNCNCTPDTWSLELAEDPPRWVKLELDGPPTGRRNGGYAHDVDGERFFLWGGTPDGLNAEPGLWSLDLARGHEAWRRLDLPGEPTMRASAGAVADPARQRILFGFGNSTAGVYVDLTALELGPAP